MMDTTNEAARPYGAAGRAWIYALVFAWTACEDGSEPSGPRPSSPPAETAPELACPQDDVPFVREATLALIGRRPLSEAETQAAAAFIAEVDAIEGASGEGRRAWARMLMEGPEFITRWQELVLDLLQVPRSGFQALAECYDTRRASTDDPALARYVRDHDARETRSAQFTFLDLMRSSLALDDLSPVYRAHLFAMLTKPNVCGNVDDVAQELSVRQEVGHVFDAAYTNRDQVCLACHNSQTSVTYRTDPAQNRHFAIAANLEQAVYGNSSGVREAVPYAVFRTLGFAVAEFVDPNEGIPSCDDGSEASCNQRGAVLCEDGKPAKCADDQAPTCEDGVPALCPGAEMQMQARAQDMPRAGDAAPWGAAPECGRFAATVDDDPAEIDAHVASIRGRRATVFDLEQVYRRGIDSLAARGLRVDDARQVDGPDEALGYLLALNIVDKVWREMIGTPLTTATRFPRTQATHDILEALTNHFVATHFSLRTLLLDILETKYFNERAPEEACGDAYALAPVLNVWVHDEPEPERRSNSSADGVHAVSARTLLSATYAALGWPLPAGSRFPGAEYFPEGGDVPPRRDYDRSCFELASCEDAKQMCAQQDKCCEEVPFFCEASDERGGYEEPPEDPELGFQRSIGVYLSIAEKGFRGFDLTARLVWEERFGACKKPDGVDQDAVDAILTQALTRRASVRDVVLALKDRLLAEASLLPGEAELVEALLDQRLDQPAEEGLASGLRRLCGALLNSPQHLLAGLAPRGGDAPSLGPSGAEACGALAALPSATYLVDCSGSDLAVKRREGSVMMADVESKTRTRIAP